MTRIPAVTQRAPTRPPVRRRKKWHELKGQPEPFEAAWRNQKTHEFRKNDRGFKVGDVLRLREWLPEEGRYTNREIRAYITYVSRGPAWGIPEGYCVMSMKPYAKVLR